MTRLDPQVIRQQIANLLLQWPELAEDDVLRADMIEGETDAIDFLRQVERKRQEAACMAGAIASNIAEQGLRQARYVRREQVMRELEFKVLQAADLKKAELPEATLSVRAGVPKVIVTDEVALPEQLFRVTRSPDKAAIKEWLAKGPVPGAEMSNSEPVLSIRTK